MTAATVRPRTGPEHLAEALRPGLERLDEDPGFARLAAETAVCFFRARATHSGAPSGGDPGADASTTPETPTDSAASATPDSAEPRAASQPSPSDQSALESAALLLLAAVIAARQGHAHLIVDAKDSYTQALLRALAPTSAWADAALDCLAGASLRDLPVIGTPQVPETPRPLIVDAGRLYTQQIHRLETDVAGLLRHRARARDTQETATTKLFFEACSRVFAHPPRRGNTSHALSDEQEAAVRRSLAQRFAVITGGPGTGKTSVVFAIVRAALNAGMEGEAIALAAPTGKAAQRLSQALQSSPDSLPNALASDAPLIAGQGPKAQTIHRLIGLRPGAPFPRHTASQPLPHELIVVDESSMIDLATMHSLLSATAPSATLVLIGDADQLPSVQVGAVFRDVATSDLVQPARLTRSFRVRAEAATHLTRTAAAIRQGAATHAAGAPVVAHASVESIRFSGVEHLRPPAAQPSSSYRALWSAFLDRWFEQHIDGGDRAREAHALRTQVFELQSGTHGNLIEEHVEAAHRLVELSESTRILVPLRSAHSVAGAAAVNRALHARCQSAWQEPQARARQPGSGWLPGEPVMALTNNPELGVFNGDQGVVVRARDKHRGLHTAVAFASGGAIRVLPLRALAGSMSLAFALTVHKSQGSEYERVAFVLPETDHPLLSRQLVYTAATRCKVGLCFVGPEAVLSAAIARTEARLSGLGARLSLELGDSSGA